MKAGTAQTCITPPDDGMLLIGPLAPATGVHDDLYARALILDDGDACVAIVAMDLLGLDFRHGDRIRAAIREGTGMPELKVMLTFSHTHSAPLTIDWSVKEWEEVRRSLNPWLDELPGQIAELVVAAMERRTTTTLAHGRAAVQVGMNRRLPSPEGVRMAPNGDGPVVPWTDVLAAKDEEGKPLAVLYSHAAHPVIVHGASTRISADYPGYAAQEIRRRLGGEVVPLFACGCAGDCNGEPLRGGFAAACEAGRKLGAAVAEAAATATALPDARLRWLETETPLPFRGPPPRAEIAALLAGDTLAQLDLERSSDEVTKRWYADSARFCLEEILSWPADREAGALSLRIAGFSVGERFALAGLSHEPFAAFQLGAERNSPFAHTMVLGYVDGVESYLPTDEALAAGGYETAPLPTPGAPLRYGYRLNLAPGVEDRVTNGLASFLNQLASRNPHQQVIP